MLASALRKGSQERLDAYRERVPGVVEGAGVSGRGRIGAFKGRGSAAVSGCIVL
jgi:hypothetical protein